MNAIPKWGRGTGSLSLVDELLVDVAVKIQLSPTLHGTAVDHYEAINRHLDRPGSLLAGKVLLFYPQGSMAIGATIRSRDEDDLFDIDLIAELDLAGTPPGDILDLLFEALNGPPGSRYHGKVVRQTRCVTVEYDDMHLDVTPMLRETAWAERGGRICHAHEDDPAVLHRLVDANPWGFAAWFRSRTPADNWFRQVLLEKAFSADHLILDRAPAEDVPDHQAVFAKPMAVVALQLTKRWARLIHERRGGEGRCIPSVIFSTMFANHAGQTSSLVEELIFQAKAFAAVITAATAKGELIEVRNPALPTDNFADRWPEDLNVQWAFKQDLDQFVASLEEAASSKDPVRLQEIFAELFGENTSKTVIKEFYDRGGREVEMGTARVAPRTATALVGLTTAPSVATVESPRHRNWGDED